MTYHVPIFPFQKPGGVFIHLYLQLYTFDAFDFGDCKKFYPRCDNIVILKLFISTGKVQINETIDQRVISKVL